MKNEMKWLKVYRDGRYNNDKFINLSVAEGVEYNFCSTENRYDVETTFVTAIFNGRRENHKVSVQDLKKFLRSSGIEGPKNPPSEGPLR